MQTNIIVETRYTRLPPEINGKTPNLINPYKSKILSNQWEELIFAIKGRAIVAVVP